MERMYVEQQPETTQALMDKEVNEATAQLKGLLGIGKAPAVQTPEDTQEEASKGKKKKNSRKKKKQQQQQQQQEETTTLAAKNDSATTGNTKGRKKQGGNNAKKKGKEAQVDEFHAWSAFQSSPDASKLPMPAFTPAVTPAADSAKSTTPEVKEAEPEKPKEGRI